MTRSRRRTPITGISCAESDKAFKVAEHRRARAALRGALARDADMPHPKAAGDPWLSAKDGKQWFDQQAHAPLMRK